MGGICFSSTRRNGDTIQNKVRHQSQGDPGEQLDQQSKYLQMAKSNSYSSGDVVQIASKSERSERKDQLHQIEEINEREEIHSGLQPKPAIYENSRRLDINYTNIPNKIHKKSTMMTESYISGLTGLTNLGNTCFMNSALQCLSNIQPLTDYFMNDLHKQEINLDNPLGSKGVVTKAYASLVKKLWTGKKSYLKPSDFLETISIYSPQFGCGTQEDAHEFLAYLLDMLHEDLNRVIKKPYIEEKDLTGKTVTEEQAAEAWKNYLMRNKSVIVDLFQGQLKSTLTCLECDHMSHRFESFMYLSVPIPDDKKQPTIHDCIREFTKEERLEGDERWRCSKCKRPTRSTKKIDLWKCPNILVVHLKRFKFTREKRGKIRTEVGFPLSNFSLKNHVASMQKELPLYDLFAICNHEGTLTSGHYTAFAKNRDDKRWYFFNDSKVMNIEDPEDALVKPEAYLLFYSKTSVEDFKRQTLSSPQFWPHFLEKPEKIAPNGVTRKGTRGMSYKNLSHQDSFKNSPSLIPLGSFGNFNSQNIRGLNRRKSSLKPAMFVVTKEQGENINSNGDIVRTNEAVLDIRDSGVGFNRFESREYKGLNQIRENSEDLSSDNNRFKKKY